MPEKLSPLEDNKQKPREHGISKIIGVPSEVVAPILESMKKPFDLPEREKTKEETEIIEGILHKMPVFIRKYGGIPVNINPEQIHFVDNEEVKKVLRKEKESEIADGFYSYNHQYLVVFDQGDDLQNAQVISHEMFHFNSYQSMEPKEKVEGVTKIGIRRAGLELSVKKDYFFTDIDEAVIEELAIRFEREYFQLIPYLSLKIKERKKFIEKLNDDLKKQSKDIASVRAMKERSLDGDLQVIVDFYQRKEEREKLRELIRDIYEKNKDEKIEVNGKKMNRFQSVEYVFDVFAKAVVSGKLLELARLVEKTGFVE